MLKKAVTPGSFLKNYLFTLLIVFLPLFMFGVFGPSEIFFGNYSEFGFIYREFGWKFLGISVVLALFIALILQIVPKFPRTLILSVLWGFTIAGYIQTMFLNKNLDQIGVSAEGYTANATRVILNALGSAARFGSFAMPAAFNDLAAASCRIIACSCPARYFSQIGRAHV